MTQSVPPEAAGPGGTPGVDRVAAFLDCLVQTVEAGREPVRDRAALGALETRLGESLRECLREFGDLRIRIDDLDLVFSGRTVYRSPAREGSIPCALYRDGLREILLAPGAAEADLAGLVHAIRLGTDERQRGFDDVATLLWEQDLREIRYVAVPADDPAPGPDAGGSIPWPARTGNAEGGASGGENARFPAASAGDRCEDWLVAHDPVPDPAPSRAPGPVPPEMTAPFLDVEADNLRMAAAIDEAIPARDQALAILTGLLDAERDPGALFDTACTVCLFIEQAMLSGDFAGANRIADRMMGGRNGTGQGTGGHQGADERAAACRQALEEVGRDELLRALGPLLNAETEPDLGELSKLLARLGSSAAPALCNLLYEVQVRKTRRAICEALVVSCKNDVGILIRQLSDPRWYVVRNVLYVLGRIAHQGVERALGEALYHSDPRVRREAVTALAEVDSPTGRAYLNSALRDPEKEIRMLVAGLISRRRSDRAAQVIWSVIESPEFAGRDAEERSAFFGALGRTGSDALIQRLAQSLTRGAWSRGNDRIARKEAALALAWLGTPAALDILRKEAGSRRDEVREAVAGALESLRRAGPHEPRRDWGR